MIILPLFLSVIVIKIIFKDKIVISIVKIGGVYWFPPMLRFFTSIPPQPSLFSYQTRRIIWSRCTFLKMGLENYDPLIQKTNKNATFRLCHVAGYKTDLLEMHAKDPKFHVVFIPGNPGVISFYTDFLESLYELLGGSASITAIGNIGQTEKDWEKGKLFSLQDQIDHKVNFIEHEIEDVASPILLVGHSIGAHIAMEIYRRFQDKVIYCIALYPFLAMNRESSAQMVISRISGSTILCYLVSSIVGLLGNLPTRASRFLVRKTIGSSWSSTAVEALRSHLFQYHTMRNVLFMVQTEFKELSGTPDWRFMRERKNQIAFLFGNDDHWGPLPMYEEVSKQIPDAVIALEGEGHTHAFSCTEAGSSWVAQHVANLIKKHVASRLTNSESGKSLRID